MPTDFLMPWLTPSGGRVAVEPWGLRHVEADGWYRWNTDTSAAPRDRHDLGTEKALLHDLLRLNHSVQLGHHFIQSVRDEGRVVVRCEVCLNDVVRVEYQG